MPVTNKFRTFAAKATMLGRRAVAHFATPDEYQAQLDQLPDTDWRAGLAGKTVVVTGASQGIGLVLSKALTNEGARVAMVGRGKDALEKAASGLEGAVPIVGDVSRAEDAQRVIDTVSQQVGPPDILINNAGVGGPWGVPFWQADPDAFGQAIDINLTGAFLMARAFARQAVADNRAGRILNVSSISTEMPGQGFAAYNASKAGLEALTRAMAADADLSGLTVATVALHSVQTERKRAHDWASHALMPPTEMVVPAFLHAATAERSDIHGRLIASWRYLRDADAEARLAGPGALRQAIQYPEFKHKGAVVPRDPKKFSINDRAENPYPPSPMVAKAIEASLNKSPLTHYPEERHTELRAALSDAHGLQSDHFAIGPGSWEVLARIVSIFAKPGEEVVSHDPGWFGFNLVCQRAGVRQSRGTFSLGENSGQPSHNLSGLLARITPQTRLVYLIHPSNPEGVALRQAEMDAFLDALPAHLPVIVDEAYIEYADADDLFDTAQAIRTRQNSIIGLRTFSKFYGLAGARVGYAYAQPDVARLIRNAEHIFSVSSVSEAAAVAALGDRAHAEDIKARFVAERARLHAGLAERGLMPLPSQCPYILAKRPPRIDEICDALENDGTYIARYAFHDDRYMMFPVSLPQVTDKILATLDAFGMKAAVSS